MDIHSMDELHPDCKDLCENLNTLSTLPPDYEGRVKVEKWLNILKSMNVSDELTGDQVREMILDFDSAYQGFNKILHQS